MRYDHKFILDWIDPSMHVLDLGCGDGELLEQLNKNDVKLTYGIDKSLKKVQECMKKGLSAIQADIEESFLTSLETNAFDMTIIGLTIHTLEKPAQLLENVLQFSKQAIVSFINCGHYRIRLPFAINARTSHTQMFIKKEDETFRYHMLSVKEFEKMCQSLSLRITKKLFLSQNNKPSFLSNKQPNLFCKTAIYQITKG